MSDRAFHRVKPDHDQFTAASAHFKIVRVEDPELGRIEPAQGSAGENIIAVKVLRDRFFGATRQLTVAAGNGQLEMETAVRADFSQIRVPRDAINFCLTAEEEQ